MKDAWWGLFYAVVFLGGVVCHAQVSITHSGDSLVIENKVAAFLYDLSKGSYQAVDKRNATVCIADGSFQINTITSTLPGSGMPGNAGPSRMSWAQGNHSS